MKNSLDLSIIILSFNTLELTRVTLRKVFSSDLGKYTLEVIVCDNGSQDGSLAMIKREFTEVKLINNRKNLGFAAGNNPGIKQSKGRYVLLLNSDTEVAKDSLRIMLEYLENNPEVGAATCKLVLGNGEIDPACHRGFPTPWAALSYFSGLEKLFPKSRLFGQYHQTHQNLQASHEVDMISGAFFLVRKKVIEEVGMLDEDYYFYGEDMDWCFRIKQAGWKIVYNPRTSTLHKKKQSGRANADKQRRVKTELFFYEYNKLFYQKNYAKQYSPLVMWLIYRLFDLRIFLLKRFAF